MGEVIIWKSGSRGRLFQKSRQKDDKSFDYRSYSENGRKWMNPVQILE